MTTRSHVHAELFEASPETLFALLHVPSAIRSWWSAASAIIVPEPGGLWAATWGPEDDPDYIFAAVMRAFEPPRRIVLSDQRYRAKSGPLPFAAEFTTEFLVSPAPGGAFLQVTQSGFPAASVADDFYAACGDGWRNTFAGIRRHLAVAASSIGRGARES
jgi:uncharacterized protein YndB with AHSA1/START domain